MGKKKIERQKIPKTKLLRESTLFYIINHNIPAIRIVRVKRSVNPSSSDDKEK
jgi:hypothetical protein